MTTPIRLVVATPMYDGCRGEYAMSLVNLQSACQARGITLACVFQYGESLIPRARNYLVDRFLHSDGTHLLFVDADIAFPPRAVFDLLEADRPIVGAACPRKAIDWARVAAACERGLARERAEHLARYAGSPIVTPSPDATAIRLDTLTDVDELGTGFLLIQRAVFTRFQQAYPACRFTPDHDGFDGRELGLFFHAAVDEATGRYLSEDYWFCREVRRMGVRITLCPWIAVRHIGAYDYQGSLAAMAAATGPGMQAW
jgi:hypothetical protein